MIDLQNTRLGAGVTAGGATQFDGAETLAEENIRRAKEFKEANEVWPAEISKEPEVLQTVLHFATPGEIEHVRSFNERIEKAQAECSKIELALLETDRKIHEAKYKVVDRSAELAARALGESASALPSVTSQSLTDLEATKTGLQTRLSEARSLAAALTGQRRAAFLDLVKTCGLRARQEYQIRAAEIGELHQALLVAQSYLNPGELVPDVYWGKLFVPGFSMKPEHTEYGIPRIASGFESGRTLPKALAVLKEKSIELFGTEIK